MNIEIIIFKIFPVATHHDEWRNPLILNKVEEVL